MPTHVFHFLEGVNTRWKEIDTLISTAKKERTKEEKLYNALCRSITVLTIAHFEGFVKDLTKALVADLNLNCQFKNIPERIKRTYCKRYIGNTKDGDKKDGDKKITLLKEKFEEYNCDISHEPFFYPVNKNPNAKVIHTVFNNFGINNVFNILHNSSLEDSVFTGSHSELSSTLTKLKGAIQRGVKNFPYNCKIDEYKLIYTEYKKKTLWEEFLYGINQKRHDVVHGNNFLNSEDINNLKASKNKIVLLELALTGIICDYISKNISKTD